MAVWPHRGHYHPTPENFQDFISFLQENEVDTRNIKFQMGINKDDDDDIYFGKQSNAVLIRTPSSDEHDASDKTVEEKTSLGFFNSLTRKLSVLEIPKSEHLLANLENRTTETMPDCLQTMNI